MALEQYFGENRVAGQQGVVYAAVTALLVELPREVEMGFVVVNAKR